MILNRVRLENFISHESSDIDLDYGINVITGPNGAGKTSILDAVSFSLFNVHTRGKKKDLVNSRARKCKLIVDFSEGGVAYTVEWSMERSKAAYGALFRTQGQERTLLARGGERTIVSEVEKILGLDKHLFLQSIYIRQGEIEGLVTATPAVRKELISRLLGIDDIQRAWGNIKDIINSYDVSLANLKGELKRVHQIESDIRENSKKLETLENSLESRREELVRTAAKVEALQKELTKLGDDKEKFSKMDSQKNLVENEIGNLATRLNEKKIDFSKASDAQQKMEALQDDLRKLPLVKDYNRSCTKKEKKELEKRQLEEKLSQIEQAHMTLNSNKANHDLYVQRNQLLQEKRRKRKNYEGAENALQTSKKQIEKMEKKKAKKTQHLDKELQTCSEILKERITAENLTSFLSKKQEEFKKIKLELETRAEEDSQQLGSLKERIEDLEYKLAKVSEAEVCPICGRELTAEHIQNLQIEYNSEKKKNDNEIAALKAAQRETNQAKKITDAKLEQIASIDPDKITGYADEIAGLEEEIAQETLNCEDLDKKAKALAELDNAIEGLETESKDLEEAYQAYGSASREITRIPSREKIEEQLKPILAVLNDVSNILGDIEKTLGYYPENAEMELAELEKKKEEYDRNEPIAQNKPKIELDLAQLNEQLSKRRLEHGKIAEEIERIGYDRSVHREKEEEWKREDRRRSESEKTVVGLETEIRDTDSVGSRLKEEFAELQEKAKEKGRIEAFTRILIQIRHAFGKDGIQKLIRMRARPILERITRDYFEKFNLEYSDIKIDDDYNITVIGPNGSQAISQISGGERVSLAIALRLAIARVLAEKVETIIMDEPTTHLDEERRKELVNILSSFFREGSRMIPQMIIITHHREIEDVADVVYNVSKRKGYSLVEEGAVPAIPA